MMADDIDELFVSHKDIWEELKHYYAVYRDIPSIEILETKFRDFDAVPTTGPTAYYVDGLRNEWLSGVVRETIMRAGSALKDEPPQKVIESLQSDIAGLAKRTGIVKDIDITDWQDAVKHLEKTRARSDKMGGSPGIRTGFKAIDTAYATGMAPGHLIVIIGFPQRGKTWFSAYLAVKAWEQGYHPMIVSLEMSREDMRNRIYGLMASGLFTISDFQQGYIDLDEFSSWGKKTLTDKTPFTIVSNEGVGDVTPMMIQGKIDQHRPDLVIMDYHQLFMDNRKTEALTPRNMNLSRELKLMAVSNNIPVIDISAVTMDDSRSQDDPPMLSQVAWSKAIEFDADMAMAVHKHNDSMIEVVERKNRHGPSFGVYLNVDLNNGKIEEHFGEDIDT